VRVMGELGVRPTRVGVVLAGIAEKVGRLRLAGSSPLSALAELESLDLRINGKLDMWNALRSSVADRVDGIDFDELIRRAERQAEELERRRLAAAAEVLAYRDGSAAPRSRTAWAALSPSGVRQRMPPSLKKRAPRSHSDVRARFGAA
jgi:hypothetical protein